VRRNSNETHVVGWWWMVIRNEATVDQDCTLSRPAVYCPPVTRGLIAKFRRADDLRSLYQVCIWLISKCRQRRQCQKQAIRVPSAQLIGESKFASAQKTKARGRDR
jgi:hypothetical protein